MRYTKTHLTVDDQVALLLERGMSGDAATMRRRLSAVSYYRLSGYWYPYRNPDDSFRTGTAFESVWRQYMFDRRLRLLVMDAVERIEVAVRTQWAYHHSKAHGPFGYADDPQALPALDPWRRPKLLDTLTRDKQQNAKEKFVEHFERKYSEHEWLPVWMAIEIMNFGSTLTLFRGSSHAVRQNVANIFGMPEEVVASWLLALNTVRNICAHHSRLWNRELGIKPKIPREARYPDWHRPVSINNARVFSILTICNYCLCQVAPHSGWAKRIRKLFEEFSDVPIRSVGAPQDWLRSPLWRNAT